MHENIIANLSGQLDPLPISDFIYHAGFYFRRGED